jgi:predicted ATPase
MLLPPRFVGRGSEFRQLDSEYRRAAAGEFRIVLLVGDPGLGKTRLAREFLTRKRDRAIGLFARAYPLSETTSFGIWSEALERYLRERPQQEIAESCGGFMDDLATLLHCVAAVRAPVPEHQPW